MYSDIHIIAENLRFSVFSAEDIRKLSVSKIITPMMFDSLGHPLPGGLYDLVMGTVQRPFERKFNGKSLITFFKF